MKSRDALCVSQACLVAQGAFVHLNEPEGNASYAWLGRNGCLADLRMESRHRAPAYSKIAILYKEFSIQDARFKQSLSFDHRSGRLSLTDFGFNQAGWLNVTISALIGRGGILTGFPGG